MPLWKIAWRSIQQRGLASSLTTFSMSLGVMLVVGVLLVHGVVTESFKNNSSLGYNMIVGAKGGKLQLVLNTVYYLSQPVENVPYDYYLEFLSTEEINDLVERGIHTPAEIDGLIQRRREKLSVRQARELAELSPQEQRAKLLDGRFAHDANRTETNLAIPVLLGDYFKQYRIVATSPKLFNELEYVPEENRKFTFAQGENFQHWSSEHGFFGAVAGSTVAREYNLKLGDKIVASHGAAEGEGSAHEESAFTLVGILNPSGTPNDRAMFVNMEGFYLMEGHAKVVLEDELPAAEVDVEAPKVASNDKTGSAARAKMDQLPLPLEEREITAILFRCKDMFASMAYSNSINEGQFAQSVSPIAEIYSLLEMIVQPIQMLLLAITMMVCIVSGVSILVSIYNSMNERKHEIAVMRALGAGRSTVMMIILLESVFLSLAGGILGWLIGHFAVWMAGDYVNELTGVRLGLFELAPPNEEVFTLLFYVLGWMLVALGSVIFIAAWLGAIYYAFRESLLWGIGALLPPVALLWCLLRKEYGHNLLLVAIFGLVIRYLGVGTVYLAGKGTFAIEWWPEMVLLPALILLAIMAGFMPAVTAYRTDVAKALQ